MKFFIKMLLFISLIPQISSAKNYNFQDLRDQLKYDDIHNLYFHSSVPAIMSLDTYTSFFNNGYQDINNYLRFYPAPYSWKEIDPKQARDYYVKGIDEVFAHVPEIPLDITLYRGIKLSWHKNNCPFEIGEEFVDKAYVSTTTTLSVAEHFTEGLTDADKGIRGSLLTLYFSGPHPKGILIAQRDEDEVLLIHNQHFRIMKRNLARNKGEKYDQYLVQICKLNKCEDKIPAEYSEW